jgi:hypothetical protein
MAAVRNNRDIDGLQQALVSGMGNCAAICDIYYPAWMRDTQSRRTDAHSRLHIAVVRHAPIAVIVCLSRCASRPGFAGTNSTQLSCADRYPALVWRHALRPGRGG